MISHGFIPFHVLNYAVMGQKAKKLAVAMKPSKTKTVRAIVGKVLDKLVSKVIALHNLESAPTHGVSTQSSSIPLSSMLPKMKGRRKAVEEDGDLADDSFDAKEDRIPSKLPISKLASKLIKNSSSAKREEESYSAMQQLHWQLKDYQQQPLEQKVELDVSRMTKRQIAAAYARNVMLVEQLKKQQLELQQQQQQLGHYAGEELDEPSLKSKYGDKSGGHRDDDSGAEADPFEESGDSQDEDKSEEEGEGLNHPPRQGKFRKTQDMYAMDSKMAKRGRPRKSVDFADQVNTSVKQPRNTKRVSHEGDASDGSLSPRNYQLRQGHRRIYNHSDTNYFSSSADFDALADVGNQEAGDMQMKRKRGRPPKERHPLGVHVAQQGGLKKSSNPFAIPISRDKTWSGNDSMLMMAVQDPYVSDSGGLGRGDGGEEGGSIIKRRRMTELRISVDGNVNSNSKNNLHSLVGGGIVGGLNTLGLSTLGTYLHAMYVVIISLPMPLR